MELVEVTYVGEEEYSSTDPETGRLFTLRPDESFFVSTAKAAQMEEDFADWFEFGAAEEHDEHPDSEKPAPRAVDEEDDLEALTSEPKEQAGSDVPSPDGQEVYPVDGEQPNADDIAAAEAAADEEKPTPRTHAEADARAEELGLEWPEGKLTVAEKVALLEAAENEEI